MMAPVNYQQQSLACCNLCSHSQLIHARQGRMYGCFFEKTGVWKVTVSGQPIKSATTNAIRSYSVPKASV